MAILKQDYIDLITSQYQNSTKFLAWLNKLFTPIQDIATMLEGLDNDFDLDYAIGAQLDIIGQIVGLSRRINCLIYNSEIGFTWDDSNLGWDKGVWTDGVDEAVLDLDDDTYRKALKIKIAANYWDGSIPLAYSCFQNLFGSEVIVAIQDNLNMSMELIIQGTGTSLLVLSYLFLNEYISFRPSGVKVSSHLNDTGVDYFCWDIEEEGLFGGWDEAYWSDGGRLVPTWLYTESEAILTETGSEILTEDGEIILTEKYVAGTFNVLAEDGVQILTETNDEIFMEG